MMAFLLAAGIVGKTRLGMGTTKSINWEALEASPELFKNGGTTFYPNISQRDAKAILEAVVSKGELAAADLGYTLSWSGFFNHLDESLVEATVFVYRTDLNKEPFLSWFIAPERAFLRWHIKKGVGGSSQLELSLEWTGDGEALSVYSQRLLTHLLEKIDEEMHKKFELAASIGSSSSAAMSGVSGTLAGSGAIGGSSLTSKSPFEWRAWDASCRKNGSVKIPPRKYAQIDPETVCDLIFSLVSAGGVLQEPIMGMQSLGWTGVAKDLGSPDGKLIETVIHFSQYGHKQDEHTEFLVIRWNIIPSRGNLITVEYEWTGHFQPSAGDLVRHLISSVEQEIEKSNGIIATPGQRVTQRSAVNSRHPNLWATTSAPQPRTFWPTMQDYNEVIQSPLICFSDLELRNGVVELNVIGLPKVATGAFASVYKITCQEKAYALRCFNSLIKDREERYKRTSRFICSDDLTYTVPLHYLEQGILVKGQWFPVLKMEWVDGVSIYDYIHANHANTPRLEALRDKFHVMMDKLREAGIAHSDLQHGNIIIKDEELYLVDYDGMFVPELSGFFSHERGHPNYQHPARDGQHFGPYLDNFSAWVIDTALLCIIRDPGFWSGFAGDAESLLFRRRDFEDPNSSYLIQKICSHPLPELRARGVYLRSLLDAPVERIPFLQQEEQPLAPAQIADETEPKSIAPVSSPSTKPSSGLPDWMT